MKNLLSGNPWLRGTWWAFALLLLAAGAVEFANCPRSSASTGTSASAVEERQGTRRGPDSGPTLPTWEWEGRWDLEQETLQEPTYLR